MQVISIRISYIILYILLNFRALLNLGKITYGGYICMIDYFSELGMSVSGMKLFCNKANSNGTIALVDVDGTLLIENEIQQLITSQHAVKEELPLNKHLIEALLKTNITNIFLFTDMTFKAGRLLERNELVQALVAKGFTVHGVITSPDYAWHLEDETLSNFYQAFVALSLDKKTEIDLKIQHQTFDEKKSTLHKLRKLIKQNSAILQLFDDDFTGQGVAGASFAKALEAIENDGELNHELVKSLVAKSFQTKLVLDCVMTLKELDDPKILLLQQLLRNLPKFFESSVVKTIFVFDDKTEVCTGVKQMNLSLPNVAIQAIRVENKGNRQKSQKTYISEIEQGKKSVSCKSYLPSNNQTISNSNDLSSNSISTKNPSGFRRILNRLSRRTSTRTPLLDEAVIVNLSSPVIDNALTATSSLVNN